MSLCALDTRPNTIINDVCKTTLQFCFDQSVLVPLLFLLKQNSMPQCTGSTSFFFYSRDHSLIFSTLAVFARFSKQYWDCLNYGETKSYTEYTSQYDMIICQELNAIVYMPRTECYSFNCSDLQWLM